MSLKPQKAVFTVSVEVMLLEQKSKQIICV